MPYDGIPVVYDGGDAVQIVASVSERTGLSAAQLDPTPLESLLGGSLVLGDADLRRCEREPSSMRAVSAELELAEAAFAAREKAAAMDHLDLAVTRMGCLSEAVDPGAAARGFLLRAALVAESGDADGARSEARTALAFDPEAVWPGGTLDGETLLADERGVDAGARLELLPPSDGTWIDGHPVDADAVALVPGLHLAQHPGPGGLHSAWVVVGGDATLVTSGSVLARMADPETRPEVEALLLAALPGMEAAYVSDGDGLWLVTVDVEGVLTIELARAEPVRKPEPVKTRKRDRRR